MMLFDSVTHFLKPKPIGPAQPETSIPKPVPDRTSSATASTTAYTFLAGSKAWGRRSHAQKGIHHLARFDDARLALGILAALELAVVAGGAVTLVELDGGRGSHHGGEEGDDDGSVLHLG